MKSRGLLRTVFRSLFLSRSTRKVSCAWSKLSSERGIYLCVLACSAILSSFKLYSLEFGTDSVDRCPNEKRVVTFAQIGHHGRLGNQLFQAAATIGIAERSHASWALPTSVSNATIGVLFEWKGNLSQYQSFTELPEATQLYHEVQIPLSACHVSLRGYYQSLKYFENSHATLRKHFRISTKFIRRVMTEVKEINRPGTVALHVRRGDYTEPPFNRLYNLLPVAYYTDALSRFKNVTRVIIVTNDRLWCQQHLVRLLDVPVLFSPFEDEVLDFVLLHLSRRIIIANSSFSWWSAFLRHLHRLPYQVIAPSTWYKSDGALAYLNDNHFFPDTWLRLSV